MSVPSSTPEDAPRIQIGELSRRTGVGTDTLRAWERRYDLLRPERSPGGFRLYGHQDEQRVHAMTALMASGVSVAEAARLAASGSKGPTLESSPEEPLGDRSIRLRVALERFEEAAANAILDDALTQLTLDAMADKVVLPAMRGIGERWERGEISIAQEHFATGILRGRMLALARNWGAGGGPMALLACPPGERHDLGLLVFGVALRDRGWRITYLGADTPVETIAQSAADLRPAAIVLAALDPERFESVSEEIAALAGRARLLIGGDGADSQLAVRLGTEALDPDPVRAAAQLAALPG